jgi:hypothetical protein
MLTHVTTDKVTLSSAWITDLGASAIKGTPDIIGCRHRGDATGPKCPLGGALIALTIVAFSDRCVLDRALFAFTPGGQDHCDIAAEVYAEGWASRQMLHVFVHR